MCIRDRISDQPCTAHSSTARVGRALQAFRIPGEVALWQRAACRLRDSWFRVAGQCPIGRFRVVQVAEVKVAP
eukprot:1048642-Alexandrium_andersonii.AAC.1